MPSGGHGLAGPIFTAAHRRGVLDPEAAGASPASAAIWRSNFGVGLLTVAGVTREDGVQGTTQKAVLVTREGLEIECVLIPMIKLGVPTATLCLSTQIGCAQACAFCETGKMGLLRDLTAAEIVSQVVTTSTLLGWNPTSLVFMGQGEPLANCGNLFAAIDAFMDRRGMAYSAEKITVCTAGPLDGLAALAATGKKRLNLAVSLHAATEDKRSQLMPINRRTSLAGLQAALVAYPRRLNSVISLNYCLMPGINDGVDDADAVARFVAPLGRVMVNVIPYNQQSEAVVLPAGELRAPSEDQILGFMTLLHERAVPVVRRVTKGTSIMAACGQLGNQDLRAKQRAARLEAAERLATGPAR